MHPAPSLIGFTTLSGLGFGLMVWLGLSGLAGPVAGAAWLYPLAVVLCGIGLSVSALHLGHPERALLAFTQWRSSWLSREAWAAATTLAVAALQSARLLLGLPAWPVLGLLAAALALATVAATAMIYTQIRAVPRWHRPATPAVFVAYALAGGAIAVLPPLVAALLLLTAGAVQIWAWRQGDRSTTGPGLASATGLSGRGDVRAFEPPHTGRSYLLDEMVYRVGRRHARRLRTLSLIGASLLPALLLAWAPAGVLTAGAALLLHLGGVCAARWLFFAEAEHVVGLYYGKTGVAGA